MGPRRRREAAGPRGQAPRPGPATRPRGQVSQPGAATGHRNRAARAALASLGPQALLGSHKTFMTTLVNLSPGCGKIIIRLKRPPAVNEDHRERPR